MKGFRVCAVLAALLSAALCPTGCGKKPGHESVPNVPDKSASTVVDTANILTDARDGKKYRTVKIGDLVWMAENLNYAAEDSSRCYVYRDAADSNCAKYGRLYRWETALNICPKGWHLSTDAEWQTLMDSAGGRDIAGKNLRAKSGWREDAAGDDALGFSAMPGGGVLFVANGENYDYNYAYDGSGGFWWSATAKNAYWVMLDYTTKADRSDGTDYNGGNTDNCLLSVRCVQDAKWRLRLPQLPSAAPPPGENREEESIDS